MKPLDEMRSRMTNGSMVERKRAIQDLFEFGTTEAARVLLLALEDDSEQLRKEAQFALQRMGFTRGQLGIEAEFRYTSLPGDSSTTSKAPEIQGYLYVLVNSSIPGLVKIGCTSRTVSERVTELSAASGVPTRFVAAWEHPLRINPFDAESRIHKELAHLREDQSREFFRTTPSEAIRIIQRIFPDTRS